jgi:hypothetical protein
VGWPEVAATIVPALATFLALRDRRGRKQLHERVKQLEEATKALMAELERKDALLERCHEDKRLRDDTISRMERQRDDEREELRTAQADLIESQKENRRLADELDRRNHRGGR